MPYFSMPINLFVSLQKVLLSSFYNIYVYIMIALLYNSLLFYEIS